ncbi:MAG: LysM peptidoglycan-binding domain-containing protein [Thermoleophilia bacterium]|nr:LysM peptidoglycan-binding domain-containing protein [Thermoleophilia bacterium]
MVAAKSKSGGGTAKVRTAGEDQSRSRGYGSQRSRVSAATARRARVRAKSPTGSGARLLAPIALAVCALAVFVALAGDSGLGAVSGGSSKSAKSGVKHSAGSKTPSGASATELSRATYRVKSGDSFAAISETTGVGVDKLLELNPGIDPRALQPGQKLKLR